MPVSCTEGVVTDGDIIKWSGTRDADGYRTYRITHRVPVDDTPGSADGPSNAMTAPGLPIPGVALWIVDGDADLGAVCTWEASAQPIYEGERCAFFDVEQVFTNRPDPKCIQRLGTGTGTGNWTDEPLLIPPRISGSFIKRTKYAEMDANGDPIVNSSFERITGPTVEIDESLPTVVIEINQLVLDLVELSLLIDSVNSTPMWGFAANTVRLTDIQWQQLYYTDCTCYFTIRFEFTINYSLWSINVLDEGTMALNGKFNSEGVWELQSINGGPPNPANPGHFVRLKDAGDNIIWRLLDGNGVPIESNNAADATYLTYELYPEIDFFNYLPGLPTSIECPA